MQQQQAQAEPSAAVHSVSSTPRCKLEHHPLRWFACVESRQHMWEVTDRPRPFSIRSDVVYFMLNTVRCAAAPVALLSDLLLLAAPSPLCCGRQILRPPVSGAIGFRLSRRLCCAGSGPVHALNAARDESCSFVIGDVSGFRGEIHGLVCQNQGWRRQQVVVRSSSVLRR